MEKKLEEQFSHKMNIDFDVKMTEIKFFNLCLRSMTSKEYEKVILPSLDT